MRRRHMRRGLLALLALGLIGTTGCSTGFDWSALDPLGLFSSSSSTPTTDNLLGADMPDSGDMYNATMGSLQDTGSDVETTARAVTTTARAATTVRDATTSRPRVRPDRDVLATGDRARVPLGDADACERVNEIDLSLRLQRSYLEVAQGAVAREEREIERYRRNYSSSTARTLIESSEQRIREKEAEIRGYEGRIAELEEERQAASLRCSPGYF